MSTWDKMSSKKTEEKIVEAKGIEFEKLTPNMGVNYLKVALHGQAKTGKTRFCMSSCESFGPTYIIATEPGIFPLSRLFPNKEIFFVKNQFNEPTVYEMNPEEIFEIEVYRTLGNISDAVKKIRKLVLADPTKVGTVVLDSVTDVWKWVQEWMKLEILKIDRNARVKNQYDWGPANLKYENIIMQLISLPCHVIFTGQDKEQYSGPYAPTGEFVARWQNQTGFKVDVVMSMRKTKDKFGKIQFEGEIEDIRHMDESLKSLAGTTIPNPDFNKLVELIKNKS